MKNFVPEFLKSLARIFNIQQNKYTVAMVTVHISTECANSTNSVKLFEGGT